MRFCFAEYVLDTDNYTLNRDGAAVQVEPQVFDLLALLAANAGKLVTRDRLIAEIWQGRIVSEATISSRINAARRAVGDDGKVQAVIRTIPRRGLEMIAPVKVDTAQQSNDAPQYADAKQTIRYTTSADGTSIAYAISGSGPPLLFASHHVCHLELDWSSPSWRPMFDRLGARHTLVRYDIRGTGLSDPGPGGAKIEQHMADMEAVADAAGISCCPVLATLNSAAVAVRLSVQSPGRFSRMILQEGYARGRAMRGHALAPAEHDPFITLLRSGGWGDPDNGYMRGWMSMVMPAATYEHCSEIIDHFGAAARTDNIIENRRTIDQYDVCDWLSRVDIPTLIIHARNGILHPLEEGRILASRIPGAEFLIVDTSNTLYIPSDPTWSEQIDAILDFLGRATAV